VHSGCLTAPESVRAASIQQLLARADGASALPRLGGMARPNGVVIVSERYWAFASTDGDLHEGTMPSRGGTAARTPLLRGLLQLAASLTPLVRGRGVARARERLLLLAALVLPFFLFALPERYELPTGAALTILLIAWLMRGRTLRLHGAEHRAIAATEGRLLGPTWTGAARPSRFSPRCGTNFVALALPVTALFDAALPLAAAPAVASAGVALLALAVTMELWKAVQHPSGLLRPLLLPGLALQRLTTREPAVADTQIALTAVASVLRRELDLVAQSN
jgi:Protein of unknown function (DUF1385)